MQLILTIRRMALYVKVSKILIIYINVYYVCSYLFLMEALYRQLPVTSLHSGLQKVEGLVDKLIEIIRKTVLIKYSY
jgi:hypothetical protein